MSQQGKVLRDLRTAWDNSCAYFEELGGEVDPKHGASIFVVDQTRPQPSDRYAFLVKPVTFVVCERAKNREHFIYVVAKGRLCIDAENANAMRTIDFATEVAYFRKKEDGDKDIMKLDHIYGAHFDYAPGQNGHPLFHAQMNDLDDFREIVAGKYSLPATKGSNYMTPILRNARLPSAQMDIFSFMFQVAADHLVHEDSTPSELKALGDLASEVRKLKGLQGLLQGICSNQCTRGVHWYS